MTRYKHVLVLILLVLPMFALAPSLVTNSNELTTNNVVVDTALPASFVEERLRVAVYVEDNTTLPFYASGGVITNNYETVIQLLESEGYDVIPMSTQDIIDHKLMAANFDAFVLVDQLPKDDIVDQVKDYWLAGGGILSFDISLGFLYYYGMIVSTDTGSFGLLGVDSTEHWGYDVVTNFTVGARHSTAKDYQPADTIVVNENTTIHDVGYFDSSNTEDFVRILMDAGDSANSVGFALDNTARQGGRIVQLPGNCSTIPAWEESIITDSIDWLAPRPKARVAFDYTHVPFYGVDAWDVNVTSPENYYTWRDTVVNHSSTFDKLYPTGEELTSDDLAPFDVLVINLPGINYTAAEITVIHDWVQDGGGLFILGENPAFTTQNQRIENIIEGLGITFYAAGPAIPASSVTTEFENHPIIEGVGSVVIASGSYLNVTAPAYPIVYFGEPNVAIAGRDYGEGRIIVVGDINGFTHSYIDNEDNYQFSINIINWLSSGPAKVLVYTDFWTEAHPNHVPLNSPIAQALNDLEIPYYLTWEIDYFNMSLFLEEWDMVIYDNTNYMTTTVQEHLIDFVEGGGKVVFSSWRMDSATLAYFGVEVANVIADPPAVYLWDETNPIFNLPAAYGSTILNTTLDVGFGINALNLTTFANATPVAGYIDSGIGGYSNSSVAIAIGAGGNVIVNGLLLTIYNDDTDDSTYPDNQEIWENEIAFLYFDRPTINSPEDVTYMETETGNEISWTAAADAGA